MTEVRCVLGLFCEMAKAEVRETSSSFRENRKQKCGVGALVTRGAFMPNLFLNEHIIQNKDGVQENRSGIPPDVFVPRFLRSWEEEGRRR